MTLREEVLQAVEQVPEFKLSELLHFARFLRDCPVSLGTDTTKRRGSPARLLGALKGQIWISDDFNEPMELVPESELLELQKYREQMLEAKA